MNLTSVIDRIKASTGTTFKLVGGAAEYGSAVSALAASPAAFAVEGRNTAQPSTTLSVVTQRVTVTFSVLIAVQMQADSRGQAGQAAVEAARVAVRSALLGWTPDGAIEPCAYAGGLLSDFIPGLLWWQDDYTTAHLITDR